MSNISSLSGNRSHHSAVAHTQPHGAKIHHAALSNHTQQTHSHHHPTLRWGSYGEEVKILQHLLNNAIAPRPGLAEDADFGDRTEIAVIGFQSAHHLLADGIVGPLTWEALEPYHDGISSMFAAAATAGKTMVSKVLHSTGGSGTGAVRKTPAPPKPVPSMTGHEGGYLIRRAGKVVPFFCQADPRWAGGNLGLATMGSKGCAVTSMAMVLAYYGRDVDPGKLRAYLGGTSLINWQHACRCRTAGVGLKAVWHEDKATRRKRIVERLHKSLPSILGVSYRGGTEKNSDHYVVCVGMAPNGHLIMNDPASFSGNGALHWQDPGNRIETSHKHYRITDMMCVDPA